jgi:hypothetical protein
MQTAESLITKYHPSKDKTDVTLHEKLDNNTNQGQQHTWTESDSNINLKWYAIHIALSTGKKQTENKIKYK